eukprot:gene8650-10149_t
MSEVRHQRCTVAAVDMAATNGYIDTVRYLMTNKTEGFSEKAIMGAAANGHLHVMQGNLCPTPEYHTRRPIDLAAANGHLSMVKLLHDFGMQSSTVAMDWAAMNGFEEIVTFLHLNQSAGCTVVAVDKAAEAGRLDIVSFLSTNRYEGCSINAIDRACLKGHLHIVKYLHDRNAPCSIAAMDYASLEEIVEFLDKHRTEGCSVYAMNTASKYGHLRVVDYLFKRNKRLFMESQCTVVAMDGAASKGHTQVIQYLNEQVKAQCSKNALNWAASNNHLDSCVYLVENLSALCDLAEAREYAVSGEHTEVVKYLTAILGPPINQLDEPHLGDVLKDTYHCSML